MGIEIESDIAARAERAGISEAELETRTEQLAAQTEIGTQQYNAYGEDGDDEFIVLRTDVDADDPPAQCIFKCFAPVDAIAQSTNQKWAGNLSQESWTHELSRHPIRAASELERARAACAVKDRRLHQIFSERRLPEGKAGTAELILRLETAFGAAAGFYQIEAMVADTRQRTDINPLASQEEEEATTLGVLDTIALHLPSALGDLVVAKELNFDGLNWERINEMFEKLDDNDPRKAALIRIARISQTTPQDVIFAANVLEFIPVRVGGKKEDFDQEVALGTVLSLTETSPSIHTNRDVAKEMNAMIRFLNWFPLDHDPRSDEVFTGSGWRYAAVCDTTAQLLARAEYGDVFTTEFNEDFKALLPQLRNLDASSARGRFLLSLIEEGQLDSEVAFLVEQMRPSFQQEIALELALMEREEDVTSLEQAKPRAIIGGKAHGLTVAAEIIPELVERRSVIIVEAVNKLIQSDEELLKLIDELDRSNNNSLSREITQRILELEIPDHLIDAAVQTLGGSADRFAIRSSATNEDNPLTGNAIGIYESIVDVERENIADAIRSVIASAYSEKAIAHRNNSGEGHLPQIGIIVEEFIPGAGGVIHIDNQGNFTISMAVSAEAATGNGHSINVTGSIDDALELPDELQNIASQVRIALEATAKCRTMLGIPVDLEFAIGPDNKVRCLQLRQKDTSNGDGSEIDYNDFQTLKKVTPDDIIDKEPELKGNEGLVITITTKHQRTFKGNLVTRLLQLADNTSDIVLEVDDSTPLAGHLVNILETFPKLYGVRLTLKRI